VQRRCCWRNFSAPIDLSVVGEPLLGEILTRGKRIHGSHRACAELLRHLLAERRRAWIGL